MENDFYCAEKLEENAEESLAKAQKTRQKTRQKNQQKIPQKIDDENLGAKFFSKDFCAHVKKIRAARKAADKATCEMDECGNSLLAARAALAISWEAVFDYCCASKDGEVSLASLNSLAGVIHKLAASNMQLKNMEAKFGGFDADSRESEAEDFTLSENAIGEIEKRLKLL